VQKIKILPEYISNKIAAGEVVNRPESVVKELMENSIDANATSIEVVIKNSGKNLIQVIDDGEGMSDEDAILSVQRHATSKIQSVEDLDAINTLGFRGEALSSIASVAILEIQTRRESDELGTIIKFDETNTIIKEKGNVTKGTSISVKNLFYNTPARRNFLKSNSTELKHIIETFKRLAICYPKISFKFFLDDDLLFDYPRGSKEVRLQKIFGENITDLVFEVKETTEYISINGFIGKPAYLRKNKGEQFFFLNNRYVQSKVVAHAVYSSFENILDKGDYPFFVLNLTIDPRKIDVNVHPSKLEVKFENEKEIYLFVQAVVKGALKVYDIVPSVSLSESGDSNLDKLKFIDFRKSERNDFSDRPVLAANSTPKRSSIYSGDDIDRLFDNLNKDIKSANTDPTVTSPFDSPNTAVTEVYHVSNNANDENTSEPFIVLLHNKYILTQVKSGLMIIDAHVAHERILYEKALKSFEANIPFSQQLLFPQSIELDPADIELSKEISPYLTKLGFEIKYMNKNIIQIVGVPGDVTIGSENDTFLEILREFRKNQIEKHLEVTDNIAKSFSCRAAVKAGSKLDDKEMRLLVDQLFACAMPYVCPHGRPIVIKLPLEELDKRFGRT